MVDKGCTAIAHRVNAIAWKNRRAIRNEVLLPRNTRGEVVGCRRSDSGVPYARAIIDGQIYTLSPSDWWFTTVRVGELRRWRDDRDVPFIVVDIDADGCSCMNGEGVFGVTYRYVEDITEVVSEAR